MKKIIISYCICFIISFNVKAQDYLTRNANVEFFSHTAMEDVRAQNNEAVSILNSTTGDIEFKIAIKSFHFAQTSMEEHFNDENYMDSQKFPKAGFKGKITNIAAVNFTKNGTYNVTVAGNLTIKDVTKPITAQGTVTIKDGAVIAQSTFSVARKDYNIMGQSFVQNKLATNVSITVNCQYEKR